MPDSIEENRTYDLVTSVPGIDAVFFGHSHQVLAGESLNGAVLLQPKNWAQQVARLDFTLQRQNGGWKIVNKHPALIPMDAALPADPDILALSREAHERTERELSTVIGRLDATLDARDGRGRDHPLVEIIHRAQLDATGADVSITALFGTFTRWEPGPVTVRDVYSLYYYDNTLYVIEITGADLKAALEHAVERYNAWPWSESEGPFNGPLFQLDFAQGVDYEVDLSQPVGRRIVNLRRNGQPLDPRAKLKVALNSYRWSGGGDFETLHHAKVVKKIDTQVRDLIVEYLRTQGTVDNSVDDNWKIVPGAAREALEAWVNRSPR